MPSCRAVVLGADGYRIVVHVRWCASVDPDLGESELAARWTELAGPLLERATALGGRIIGWGAHFLCVDFSWDALYDALDFLVDAPLLPELASGICSGELTLLLDSPRVALATGGALYLASRLADLARPGEILVSPRLVRETDDRLGTLGPPGPRPGRPEVEALILDPQTPLEEDPHSEIPASVRSRSSWPTASRRVRPPDVESEQVERLAGAAAAVQLESSSTFPEALAAALRERSSESLSSLAARAADGPPTHAMERMSAMAQLVSGQGGDAIRRLRAAREQAVSEGPAVRCRAALALAVALAALGRNHEAVLEGLAGLARAREAHDDKGERACARLLASLAVSLGDDQAAASWNQLCP